MTTRTGRGLVVVACVAALLSISCGDDESELVEFSAPCAGANGECEAGLFCAESGRANGLCTESCDASKVCRARHGDAAYCHLDGVCVLECGGGDSSCPGGSVCESSANPDTCVTP